MAQRRRNIIDFRWEVNTFRSLITMKSSVFRVGYLDPPLRTTVLNSSLGAWLTTSGLNRYRFRLRQTIWQKTDSNVLQLP